ncbi:MAG: ferritin family protein [Deltaproteobacteria bacterium]|nr:MAG: ferritin family protein [Deltaproteobacteria bacterium]
MFSVTELIEIAIRIEKNGESYYREALAKASDPPIESMLRFLADQEVKHVQWFEQLKQNKNISAEDGELAEISGAILENLVADQRFSLDEVDVSQLEGVQRLLAVAIEFEKDTVLFYQVLRSLIDDPDSLAGLDEIIAEENRHIQILKDYSTD